MTTIEQLGRLTAQYNEIIKRVVNGSLNPISVKRALQNVIEGSNRTAESIVERVELQLVRWSQLGVTTDEETRERILQQASIFDFFTDTDEPLVSGGFGYALSSRIVGRLWDAFVTPAGDTKYRYVTAKTPLKYVPRMRPTGGGLHLIHFDPNAYQGVSPADALEQAKKDKVRLASIEVLERLALDPDWAKRWNGKSSPYPNLSGLRAMYDSYEKVPCVGRYPQVCLTVCPVDAANDGWSSPVVRKC